MNNSDQPQLFAASQWFTDEVSTPSGINLPYFLTQLNTMWPDLQDQFNVHAQTVQGVVNTFAIWENPLRLHSPDVPWSGLNSYPAVIFEAEPEMVQDALLTITRGMVGARNVRADLGHFDLNTALGRQQFVHWRLSLGFKEYRYLVLSEKELKEVNSPCQWFNGKLAHLPRLAELLMVSFAHEPELYQGLLAGDVGVFDRLWAIAGEDLQGMAARAAAAPAQPSEPEIMGQMLEGGVNIIGFPRGQFGIGEDARTATRAMVSIGVKPAVCEAPIELACAVVKDEWLNDLIQTQPQYKVNLITMPAPDTLRLYFLRWIGALSGRYNICAWQWELPHWPQRWHKLLSIPDEIWAQSRYVQNMFEQVTNKPVTYMPLSLEVPVFSPLSRSHFDLNENTFTFLSVFDCNSWFQRKNPMAAIRAFQAAFPPHRKDVQLVVKMMNSKADMPEYLELMRTAAQDLRIVILDQFLSRNDMLALLDCADVFVSLHRSEGFGRVVAECMLMGKPVISTNYSGSVDFAFEGTAYVVDGPLVPLKKGDYSEYEGQHWMDPDVGLAAEAMKRCVDDPVATAAMALRGQAHVRQHHSIEAIANRYRQRFLELGLITA